MMSLLVLIFVFFFFFFFFFQAEDGIRDLYVTGVQTCALPISILISRQQVSRTFCKPIDKVDSWYQQVQQEICSCTLKRSMSTRLLSTCKNSLPGGRSYTKQQI